MNLYTFNGTQITGKSVINFMPNAYDPPYIRPHVILKMHQITYSS